ncbi:uncharacterized protein MELLADRAFT_89736 [Melampsora larici-populina 98AG31]|uniref:Uncharacterized protein n=1 Tax=Melampsora larici-populina (strain 98AG31 / pathotype 3-4-7) TaxID=747676 RepID=F4RUF5_MELLP|nr:uncharacterized protein MELLADRAFT_89736 [Melampsora larici-populina 98AG31]EGG03926.1 hypothetical protein MELLADRAFT_89736 [Melampsora larici-populina 98AG31]
MCPVAASAGRGGLGETVTFGSLEVPHKDFTTLVQMLVSLISILEGGPELRGSQGSYVTPRLRPPCQTPCCPGWLSTRSTALAQCLCASGDSNTAPTYTPQNAGGMNVAPHTDGHFPLGHTEVQSTASVNFPAGAVWAPAGRTRPLWCSGTQQSGPYLRPPSLGSGWHKSGTRGGSVRAVRCRCFVIFPSGFFFRGGQVFMSPFGGFRQQTRFTWSFSHKLTEGVPEALCLLAACLGAHTASSSSNPGSNPGPQLPSNRDAAITPKGNVSPAKRRRDTFELPLTQKQMCLSQESQLEEVDELEEISVGSSETRPQANPGGKAKNPSTCPAVKKAGVKFSTNPPGSHLLNPPTKGDEFNRWNPLPPTC